jgi:hypothetical protein
MLPIERDLLEIERFDPEGESALSAYLDLGAAGGPLDTDARLAQVLGPIADRPNGNDTPALEAAAEMVREGIRALEHVPRALAVFASVEPRFLKLVPLPKVIEPKARWGPHLHIGPLISALDENERTVVILVDELRGRVLRLFLGEIEEVVYVDDSHGPEQARAGHHLTAGGADEPTRARRHDWHVRRHLERILEAFRRKDLYDTDRILLGGSQETVHELLRLMPQRLRGRTRLVSGVPLGAGMPEILERVTEVQRQAEREREEELLDNLLERDRAHAVFGVAAVLEAVAEGRVHTLVYGAETSLEGSECSSCGWLMAGPAATACPRCNGRLVAVPDLMERVVSLVLQAGGRVEEVRGPAMKTLAGREGLSALLRYTPVSAQHRNHEIHSR